MSPVYLVGVGVLDVSEMTFATSSWRLFGSTPESPTSSTSERNSSHRGLDFDLFARQRRLGWDAWGDDLDKFPTGARTEFDQLSLPLPALSRTKLEGE